MALAAGVLGAVQPKVNAALSLRVGSALLASLVNFVAAFAAVLVMLLLRGTTRRRLRAIRTWPVPRWTLLAGLGGVAAVLAGALAVETIGVAVFSVAFFAGQISFGLLVDRLDVGGAGVRRIVPARIQASALAMAAVVVSQTGRPVGEFALTLVVLVVCAGGASAFQSAFNGRITRALGDAFAPTAVNVTVGLTALALTVGVLSGVGRIDRPVWPTQPGLYLGGLLGVCIVLSHAIASGAIGVLRATLAMLAAQLIAAFLVDWMVEAEPPTLGVIAGASLIVFAVVLIGREQQAVVGPILLDQKPS